MPITSDFHSHIARSSAIQMVQSARQKNLQVLGISEHIFQMSDSRSALSHMPLEGPLLSLAQYFAAVHAAAHDLQFKVRLGLEVDFIPGKNEHIQATFHGYAWDFLIGSIHEIDGTLFEHYHITDRAQGEALWSRYFVLLRDAINSHCFDIISHPTRMCVCNPYLPANIDDEYDHLADDATRCNVALEINGFDMLTYPETVRRLVRACMRHETPLSVGSDAHLPDDVAQAQSQTEELLRELGITTIRTWRRRKSEEYEI